MEELFMKSRLLSAVSACVVSMGFPTVSNASLIDRGHADRSSPDYYYFLTQVFPYLNSLLFFLGQVISNGGRRFELKHSDSRTLTP
jgi:hypothetical protein